MKGEAYTRSAALTEGQVSGVLAPAYSPMVPHESVWSAKSY